MPRANPERTRPRTPRLRRGWSRALSVLIATVLLGLSFTQAWAVLHRTSRGTDHSVAAATTFARKPGKLTDSDHGKPMFTAKNLAPGKPLVRYIRVTYRSGPSVRVRLMVTPKGSAARYLQLTVVRGKSPQVGPKFRAGKTLYRGALSTFPRKWAKAIRDPGLWKAGNKHSYRFTIVLSSSRSAMGQKATATFRWQARTA